MWFSTRLIMLTASTTFNSQKKIAMGAHIETKN